MSIIHMYVLKLLFHSTTLTVSYEYNTAFSLFFVVFLSLLDCLRLGRGTTAPEGDRGRRRGKRRKRRSGLQTALDMSPVFIHRWRMIGSVSSVCRLCCHQESIEEVERGRVDVRTKVEGSGGWKGRGLALGLFAALSFPLSTLAHLHLCQLDVPQHVGVCDGKRKM